MAAAFHVTVYVPADFLAFTNGSTSRPSKSYTHRDIWPDVPIEYLISVDGLNGFGKFCDKLDSLGSELKFSRSVPVDACMFDCENIHGKRKIVL